MRKRLLIIFTLCLITLIWLLSEVFSGKLILPQYFSIGPLTVHYYGIIMAAAVAAGFYLAIKRSPAFGITAQQAEDLLFWLIIGGFIGARLYHVASSYQYYLIHPADVVKVWNGGLSIYGALIGGLISLLICSRLNPKPLPTGQAGLALYPLLDWLSPSVILGQLIGRLGNFFNYEAFGYPTNLPWKMFVPLQFRPANYLLSDFFHPFFLYEAIGSAIILFLLLRVIKTKAPGALFFWYLLLYNILRFGLEFLRVDSTFIGQLRLNAISSLILVVISADWLLYNRKYDKVP